MKKAWRLVPAAAMVAVGLAQMPAQAVITATNGAAVKISPPPDVRVNKFESNTQIRVFDEQQNVVLVSPVAVDITTPGTYDDSSDLTPGVIPAGTSVSSQFMHCDKVGSGGGPVFMTGRITVDGEIIGIQILGSSLDSGDGQLGAPGTLYPTGDSRRQLNLDQQTDFVIEPDLHTVQFHCDVNAHADQVRVITKAPGTFRGACVEYVNPHGKTIPPAGSTTLPGPKGGQNEDGFYKVGASDEFGNAAQVIVIDTGTGAEFGPYPSGTNIKYTEANGQTPNAKKIGATNGVGQSDAVLVHIQGQGDAAVVGVLPDGSRTPPVSCLVPPPPK